MRRQHVRVPDGHAAQRGALPVAGRRDVFRMPMGGGLPPGRSYDHGHKPHSWYRDGTNNSQAVHAQPVCLPAWECENRACVYKARSDYVSDLPHRLSYSRPWHYSKSSNPLRSKYMQMP